MYIQLLYQFPTLIQRLYRGVVWRMSPSEKKIYLTFDDGCIPQVTPQVLDILNKYGVKATFFCVGDNIRKYPDVFKRIVEEGHSVGNHTFHHISGLKTSFDTYMQDVAETDRYIEKYSDRSDKQTKPLFRPPYGRMSLKKRIRLHKTHTIILWDVLTHDYNKKYTPDRIVDIVKKYSRNGSIVVFHDSLKSEKQMLPALPQVIEYWQNNGFTLDVL